MSLRAHKPEVLPEHEFEAQPGLPEPLPPGERLLWQGTPRWDVLARRVFHVHHVALYFAAMLAWHGSSLWRDGASAVEMARALAWSGGTAAFGLALLLLLARMTARGAVYTLTDKRIVMRIGIVLTVTYNLPLKRIEAADLQDAGSGCGDIALTLEPATRIAWLHLWPHARPWQVRRPRPMLRALPDAKQAAALLGEAWAAANANANAAPATAAAATQPGSAASTHSHRQQHVAHAGA